MPTPTIVLRHGVETRLHAGQVWVFRDDVQRVEGTLQNGESADVVDRGGSFLGRGFVSTESRILLRILSQQPVPLDHRFLRRRLRQAVQRRREAGLPRRETDAFRMVFAEADGLPGLIVDNFGDCLVLSAQTVAMDQRKEFLARELLPMTRATRVYERSDVAVRQREGLAETSGWLVGDGAALVEVQENGIRYRVNFGEGMKTGHFCDQRDNRSVVQALAKGRRTLDAFSYTGGFALGMLAGGAESVLALDQSEEALGAFRENVELNGFDPARVVTRCGSAFALLRDLVQSEPSSFDLVVIDPPAFARSRENVQGALRGYKEINLQGLRLVQKDGYLLTCSCSHHVSREAFRKMLRHAAQDTRKRLRLVGEYGHAVDHPVILNLPESEYLKAYLLQVQSY